MKDRIILHCDLNNFFASVSVLYNPTLYNLPIAVCGDKENRHGIVLAKNEIAKKCGVKTAEPIFEALKKCPELIILPPIFDKYEEFSRKAFKIYSKYTDMIEPFGIDECWLDVTGSTVLFGDGYEIADKIRKQIKSELGITISVGVSFNKTFAKLGSDMKKPDAITIISRENFKEKVWLLPVTDLLFVGKSTAEKFNSCGIFTVGDITKCHDTTLKKIVGKTGLQLKQFALGNDFSPVVTPTLENKPKSVGRSVTLSHDFTSYDDVWRVFLSLAQTISDTLRLHNLYSAGMQVHIRTASLTVKEFSKTFPDATNCAIIIAERGIDLLKQNYLFTEPLRSVGIRAVNLKSKEFAVQEDIFGEYKKTAEQEKIENSIFKVRQKFGKSSIRRAGAEFL